MLDLYGWSDTLQADLSALLREGQTPARVIAQHRGLWRVVHDGGELDARITGRLAAEADEGMLPVVGDWVALDLADATIHAVAPRRTAFSRRAAGGHGLQVLCANVDVALLAMSLNDDFNPSRLERYLVGARDCGAAAVVVLTKVDLVAEADAGAMIDAVSERAGGAPIVAVSSRTGEGLDALRAWLAPGQTAVMLGSSGVGKSTLLNRLAGEEHMETGAVREADDRGRHTTRHRALFRLPGGALLIDTPGMREFGLAADDDALDETFSDVVELAQSCRFSDCGHTTEPGCAVQAALADGTLPRARWESFLKLQRELAFEKRRVDPAAAAAERRRWKSINKNQKAKYRHRDRLTDHDPD